MQNVFHREFQEVIKTGIKDLNKVKQQADRVTGIHDLKYKLLARINDELDELLSDVDLGKNKIDYSL